MSASVSNEYGSARDTEILSEWFLEDSKGDPDISYEVSPLDLYNLIAKVREDEKANQALAKAVSGGDNYFRGYAAALRDATEAVLDSVTCERGCHSDAATAIEALGGKP